MPTKNRVVITGIGLVSPVGNNTVTSWKSIINGNSGISCFKTSYDLGYASSIAGQVKNEQELIDDLLSVKEQRKTDRFIHLALIAAYEAVCDSGLTNLKPEQQYRFGSYVGVGIGGLATIGLSALRFKERGYKAISPFLLPKAICNEAVAWLSIKLKLKGPTMAVVNACSSGNDAIGQAFRAISDGHVDYMLAGGTESCLTPLSFAGFGNMRALASWKGVPEKASRPFDKDRCGFVISEGASFLVLEREDFARQRGANIYAEIVGYGATTDAYHITAIHPDGEGAVRAINIALKEAGVDRSEIGYVNAHGTATLMNDPVETKVLKTVFGHYIEKNNQNRILVSSTKSMTGHMLGAAGGLEVAFTALALKHKVFPPTINLDNSDSQCDLDYIPHVAREANVSYAISNSFGFGGANSVILLKRV